MSTITILHLSDIHFKPRGLETEKTFRRHVSEKMMEAIKEHLAVNPVPDVAAVTGDIAYSGKEEEYQEAGEFFKNLKELLPPAVLYLVVPGNHDVDRAEISEFFSLHSIVRAQKIDRFLENKKELNKNINPKFRAFRGFVDDFTPGLYQSKEDYFWVKEVRDKGVSFLGLNSCWACENDKDKDNIALGYPQVMEAFRQAKMPGCILLMHHPPKWLNEIDFDRYEGEIFKRCGLILHGHTHSLKSLVVTNPSASCICLGANASYTDEKKHGFIGFQFIRVEFCREGAAVTVWPYRLETMDTLRFVPDVYRYEAQGGKPFFELKTFEEIPPPKQGPKGKPPLPPEIPKEYREWVKHFHSTMDIDLLAKKGEVITVNLPEVYISIETANPFYEKEQEQLRKTRGDKSPEGPGEEAEAEAEGKEPASIDIEELVGRKHRLLLRGGAGTGKTTLIKHLAYSVTSASCYPALNGYLPVMLFLKDLWLIYSEELKNKKKVVFEDLLTQYLEKSKCPLTIDTINNYLAHHQVLFLIDGLDEVQEHLRPDLVEMIAHFQFENKGNRFLLTGRPHGIAGRAASRFGSDLHDIEPLNDRMVKDFIKKWFHAVSGRAKGVGDVTAESMISDIQQHEHISMFTQNPLLLTAVCILYQDGKRIPEQRADLYNRIVDNLINRRFHDPVQPGKENEILEYLMHLAFTAQQKNRKTIEISDALASLRNIFKRRENEREAQYELRIANVFNEIEPNCGLFNRLSSGEFEFTHLTFQEFLAAKHMVYMGIEWEQFLEKEWWEEALLLYAGFMSIDRKRDSNAMVETILEVGEKKKKSRNRLQLLAGKALYDFQAGKREQLVVSRVRETLYGIMESRATVEDRFQAGEIVGGLGDTRIRPDNMVLIPAGEFIRGSNEIGKEEKPERRIYLDAFEIGIYPVTNQEFKRFVEDKGYHMKESWMPEGWEWRVTENIFEPELWHDRQWNGANFPVVGISWYEAVAYANWLSKVTGKNYRLPTEAEWEKAARGTGGREYPWGNGFDKNLCNSYESNLKRTSPVGIYPGGQSPYGCFDMAGNVWEWCADWVDAEYYKDSPAENPKGPANGHGRVHRGGGWGTFTDNCASAIRGYGLPGLRWGLVGVRLARSL